MKKLNIINTWGIDIPEWDINIPNWDIKTEEWGSNIPAWASEKNVISSINEDSILRKSKKTKEKTGLSLRI